MQIVPFAKKDNGDTIRVSVSAPAATTIVLREASAVALVAVNEVVDEVAEQEIAEDNTMLVAKAYNIIHPIRLAYISDFYQIGTLMPTPSCSRLIPKFERTSMSLDTKGSGGGGPQ